MATYCLGFSLSRTMGLTSLLILCSGCINLPPDSDLPTAPRGAVPQIMPAATLDPYRLQVGDVIDIKLLLNPELNDEVTVLPDGSISTIVAQDVKAYGRTPKELQKDLEHLYGSQLKKPHVTVVVRSFAPNRVYVAGEVNSPGEFITIGPNLTLAQAIARAGGLKNSAQPDDVVILRRGADENPVAYIADYKAAVTGADPSGDVRLAPYDVVFVPRSDVGDVYLYFQQYVQEFVPSSFGMSYQLNPTNTVTSPSP